MSSSKHPDPDSSKRPDKISVAATKHMRGFHLQFANGWLISVQIGPTNYHSARGAKSSPNAEIAVWHRDSPMVQWADSDTVQGHVDPDRIARVITYISQLPDSPSAWGSGSTLMWLGINGNEETLP